MEKIWNFLKDEDGIETAEYAVMGALVVIVAAGAAIALGIAISNEFGEITTAIGQ
jgi:Flp pilus assembly pilin Flp